MTSCSGTAIKNFLLNQHRFNLFVRQAAGLVRQCGVSLVKRLTSAVVNLSTFKLKYKFNSNHEVGAATMTFEPSSAVPPIDKKSFNETVLPFDFFPFLPEIKKRTLNWSRCHTLIGFH